MSGDRSRGSVYLQQSWPWYTIGILLLICAIAVFVWFLNQPASDTKLVVAVILFIASCVFFLGAYTQNTQESFEQLPTSTEELKKLGREYYRNTTAIQDNSAAVKELHETLSQKKGELGEIRKNIEEILIKQRQETGNLRREVEDWQRAAIEFFRMLERALDYEKNAANRQLIEKITSEFSRSVTTLGLERIMPQADEAIEEKLHEAVGEEESASVQSGNITRCITWGYRIGANVIERALVIIAKETKTEQLTKEGN